MSSRESPAKVPFFVHKYSEQRSGFDGVFGENSPKPKQIRNIFVTSFWKPFSKGKRRVFAANAYPVRAEKGLCPFILLARRAVPGDRKSARRRCARRAVPGDTQRAHRAVPGDTRRAHCASPLTLADCISAEPIVLFACAAGGQEASPVSLRETARPSCQSPPPKAFPALGIHPASGSTSLLVVKRCSISHNASSFPDYREIHPYSQPKSLAIRSTPRMQRHVSDLSASPRQGVQRKSVRLSPDVSLCTHCHDGVVRSDTYGCPIWR